MYLQQIAISNFRLFNSFSLHLNPGLNILVGENDSGKTALIDAIRYVLGTNSSEQVYIEEDFHNNSNQFSIQLKFSDVDQFAHVFLEHLTYEEHENTSLNRLKPVLYITLKAQRTGQEKRGYPLIRFERKSGLEGNGLTLEPEIRKG